MLDLQQKPGVAQPQQRVRRNFRTFHAPFHIAQSIERGGKEREALSVVIETVSAVAKEILEELLRALYIEQGDDNEVLFADLIVPCHASDRARAFENANKPRRQTPIDKGPKEAARPQYKNSYHLEDVFEEDGVVKLIFRIAERFSWEITRGPNKGQKAEDLNMLDVTQGLQQVIMSWMRPSALAEVPAALRAGVCQHVAQQLLSHIGLVEYGRQPNVGFPSVEERSPQARLRTWVSSLLRLTQRVHPFEYARARDLYPAADDPRGDRLVNVDPDWIAFVKSPFPGRLPLNFVKADDVVVYERRWVEFRRHRAPKEHRQLYAALPIFGRVSAGSRLAELACDPALGWWKKYAAEFHALGAWEGKTLNPKHNLLVLPLEHGHDAVKDGYPGWFEQGLSGRGGRAVHWSLVVQRQKRVGERAATPIWEIHFATSRVVVPVLRPHVLGIHFVLEGIWWVLTDKDGATLEKGILGDDKVLTQALQEKARLEELQGQLRWVGDRRSARSIQTRTYEVARSILALAREHDANLAIEKIDWVDKRRGGPEANRIYSMWNYADLAKLVEWLGLEDAQDVEDGDNGTVLTLRWVSDYVLRYTCPQCKACRKARQTKENADTWLEGEVLECRKCGFKGEVPNEFKAGLVASIGASRLRELLAAG